MLSRLPGTAHGIREPLTHMSTDRHGGGANKTSIEDGSYRERMGFFISHCAGYLRPQEIQLVSVPRPVVREMPRLLQVRLSHQLVHCF